MKLGWWTVVFALLGLVIGVLAETALNTGRAAVEVAHLQGEVNALHGQVATLWAQVQPQPPVVNCPLGELSQWCLVMKDTGFAHNGQVIMSSPGRHPGTPWMVTDYKGAAMAWVNLYGLFSGGDGKVSDGGALCVTYRVSGFAACLSPTGDLTLTPTGPRGPTGPSVTLTARDIAWIHSHGG